jgi:hypothetical protein
LIVDACQSLALPASYFILFGSDHDACPWILALECSDTVKLFILGLQCKAALKCQHVRADFERQAIVMNTDFAICCVRSV